MLSGPTIRFLGTLRPSGTDPLGTDRSWFGGVNRLLEICSLCECEAFAEIDVNTTPDPENNITNIDIAPKVIKLDDFGNLQILTIYGYIMSVQEDSRSFARSNTISLSSFK